MNWTNKDLMSSRYEHVYKDSYYHNLDITLGFILGFILDNIIPLTFGLFTKFLKQFGKSLKKIEIRYNNKLVRYLCN